MWLLRVSIRRKVFLEPFEVFALAAPGEAGEDVVDAEEEAALGEIHQQCDQIIAALLQLQVLAFGDVVDADVHFGAAGHFAGELFAHEKIRDARRNFSAPSMES